MVIEYKKNMVYVVWPKKIMVWSYCEKIVRKRDPPRVLAISPHLPVLSPQHRSCWWRRNKRPLRAPRRICRRTGNHSERRERGPGAVCRSNIVIFKGHSRNQNWRYLPYIRPIFQAYVRGYPQKIWPYMVQYLHFRILEWPLIYGCVWTWWIPSKI